MATIKTCDRCGKVLKGKRYFCGFLNPFGDDYDIEESIHVDLCGDCYDKFKKYFLKELSLKENKMLYASEEFMEVNRPIFENDIATSFPITEVDISEWQKDKLKEALNGNNKNM